MSDWLIVAIGAITAMLVPEIAVGASVGSLFFMLASGSEKGWRKVALLLVGWFVGYFAATPFSESGWAGLISVFCSAFAVVVMLQVFYSLENPTEGSPKVVDWLVDVINKIRRG